MKVYNCMAENIKLRIIELMNHNQISTKPQFPYSCQQKIWQFSLVT